MGLAVAIFSSFVVLILVLRPVFNLSQQVIVVLFSMRRHYVFVHCNVRSSLQSRPVFYGVGGGPCRPKLWQRRSITSGCWPTRMLRYQVSDRHAYKRTTSDPSPLGNRTELWHQPGEHLALNHMQIHGHAIRPLMQSTDFRHLL